MKKLFILVLNLLFGFTSFSQGFICNIADYDFINYTENEIRVPGQDTSLLKNFYDKLASVRMNCSSKINILHIGGSHVQADIFSNRVRLNLDSFNLDKNTSRGLIFPFKVAKTNNPLNYKVKSKGVWTACRNVSKNKTTRLGMTGISVTTKDNNAEISVSLNPNDSVTKHWNFNHLRILGYAEEGYVKPVLKITDEVYLEGEYDSISSSYMYNLPYSTDSFTIVIKQTDSLTLHPFTLTGFIPANDRNGIIYHAIGVNGASVPSYLKCEDFERDLKLIKPDLVVFGIGINDAVSKDFSDTTFVKNYSKLIDIIQRVSPNAAFIFITNNDSYKRIKKRRYKVNPNGQIARQAFYTLAEKYKSGVWDLFEIMGGLGSMQKWEEAGLARHDKIHFTEKGYTLIGDLFYNAIVNAYLSK